ncbi:BamA/TamA family outer membrane protein [Thioclava sp. JE_KL1]|uniref:BamA/TamA family outer membrane protein n=1 Tax=Thioclava sp. JE_KL1 TaxID=2651187 RepID=UPI00128B4D66|nr:BamA/TamA family outer membrane protein [Thioclava sp. JE_KL1]MPQ95999.1 BamA/TamA family outer membrane protein [Thioclava sp. JE_KL1]
MSLKHLQSRTLLSIIAFSSVASVAIGLTQANARSFKSVEVEGNKLIASQDILAACDLKSGVDYSPEDLDARADCLRSSGVFNSVKLRSQNDALVVDVKEVEMRPGHIDLSVAYDTQDKVVGSLYFERYNLFPNTFGSLEMNLGKEMQSLRSSLYYSGLGDGKPGVGMDALFSRSDYDDQGYASRRAQIEGYLAQDLGEAGRLEYGLGYRSLKMRDTSDGSSTLFQQEESSTSAPYLRFSYKLASASEKGASGSAGYQVGIDQYFWGLGDIDTVSETRLNAKARLPLGAKTDLLLGFQGGVAKGLGGDNTRAVDRFQLGGVSFRGFAPRGLGPKDADYFTGGNKFAVASIELQHDLGTVFDTPMRGGAFIDVGALWSLDDTQGGAIDDSFKLRSSIGLSVTFDIQGAPVSLYVAKAMDKAPGDDTQSFGLSVAARF